MAEKDLFLSTFHEWLEIFMGRSMKGIIKYARESGLSMSMLGALFHLHWEGKSAITNLGQHLGVTSAGASQMLDRLVQEGLIQRSEDPDDRRVKQVALSQKGCRVLEEGILARHGWLLELSEVLSGEEKDQITAALEVMIRTAQQENPN